MIIPGTILPTAGGVKLPPPVGFNTTTAVRIGNLTTGALILTNVDPGNSSQEYLLPNQQNVYVSTNTAQNITLQSQNGDSPATIAADLYVEWSTESDWRKDFQGVYPAQITASAQVLANAIFATGVPNVLLAEQVLPDVSGFYNVGQYSALMIALAVGAKAIGGIPPTPAVPAQGVFTLNQSSTVILIPGGPLTGSVPAYRRGFSLNTTTCQVDTQFHTLGSPQLMVALPVRGQQMTANYQPGGSGTTHNVIVMGTNISLDEMQISNPSDNCIMTLTTLTAGLDSLTNGITGTDYFISAGGSVQVIYSTSIAADIYVQSIAINAAGNPQFVNTRTMRLAVGVDQLIPSVTLPPGLIKFVANGVAGTANMQLDITQNG